MTITLLGIQSTSVLSLTPLLLNNVRGNAWRASLGKITRKQYLLRYPVNVMRPDGSTVEVRAAEPRQIVQLPIDLKMLSDDERRQRLAARKPKAKKIKQEVIDDNFQADDYMQLFSQKSK